MGESVFKSISSFFSSIVEYVIKATKPLEKDDIATRKWTKEDIPKLLILIDNHGVEKVPAKKPVSDSEAEARLQEIKATMALARLLEKHAEKVRAQNPLKITSYGPVTSYEPIKAKAESSLKEHVKDVSSEDNSEDEKESDEDEKSTEEDTKTTKTESTSSDDSSQEWIMDYDNVV